MKLSRDWLSDFVDLSDLSDEELSDRFTSIGHAVEAIERHGEDTVFDLEIGTNRVDAMSHIGMARELAAALGRDVMHGAPASTGESPAPTGAPSIRIDVPEMCRRYTGLVIRDVTIKPSTEHVRRRLEAVGLRPINNVVDVTNYVMMAAGHPLHAFDLDLLQGPGIVVRAGTGERIQCLDGETRVADRETCVIADRKRGVALGGIIGGAQTEISEKTRNVLLECAWFTPGVIRRTARRLGIKTDASYRFERGVDANDTLFAIDFAASLIVDYAGGRREAPIDVVAVPTAPRTLRLRSSRLKEASGGVIGVGYALELFRRLGFQAKTTADGIEVVVPTYRGDIHEEMDLVEEVLRFYGYNRIPASLPRVTTGDARPYELGEAEDAMRTVLVGSGMAEVVNYSFLHADHNALFGEEQPIAITNALSENITSMRLSLMPGLLETVAHNRAYGVRDGALFEIGRTYHRDGDGVREHHRLGMVLFGAVGAHWGDSKRPVDFYDIKGIVEQVAAKRHLTLEFAPAETKWLRQGRRAVARLGERQVATLGFIASDVLQRFGVKGDVAAAEIDIEALLAATSAWTMAPVARFPGVPMILALTHGRDLPYERLIETIRGLDVPHLHEVGLRDRFAPDDNADVIKTTLGMWYQAFDRSLTQEEVGQIHQNLASRVAGLLPVTLVSQEKS